MQRLRYVLSSLFFLCMVLVIAACSPAVSTQSSSQQKVTINKSFQGPTTPIPTVPAYRCGAWSSNNAPGTFSTITIYARLTKDITPVAGVNAAAVVHFQTGDVQLTPQAPSDSGGYVTFTLQLQGRQPSQVPATVEVTFTGIPGGPGTLHCTSAFFTPQ